MTDIAKNLAVVKKRINEACKKTGRNPDEIKLVAVSKEVDEASVEKGIEAGISDFGENRVQELQRKYGIVKNKANWHFVGHLQKNKVKYIIGLVELIHSVESLKLVEEINKRAGSTGIVQKILVQVNISGEQQKYGIHPSETEEFLNEVSDFEHISVKGLMMMAPFVEAEETRVFHKSMKKIFDEVKKKDIYGVELKYLSMGMTNDFEVAIEEGSNLVRIGTAIFKSS